MSQDQSKRSAANLEAYEDDAPPPRSTGFVGFLIPVVAVVGLGAGALYLYKGRVDTNVFVADKLKEARDKIKKDDLKSLKEAEALYTEALEKDGELSAWKGHSATRLRPRGRNGR